MNIYQLKYFSAVAETLNFSRAAERMAISQPALSAQIQSLERTLKTRLFERTKKSVALTEAGKVLQRYCVDIFSKIEETKRAIYDISEKFVGTINIGTINSIGIHILPNILKSFMKKYPMVNTLIHYKDSRVVLDMIRENKIDFGIIATSKVYDDLEMTTFLKDEMFVVCGVDHPFYKKKAVGIEELKGQKFIHFDKEAPSREIVESFLLQNNVSIEEVISSVNIETIKKMVEIGMGVSILSEHAIALELKSGILKALPIKGRKIARDLVIINKKDKYLSRAAKAFKTMVMEYNAV